jgi:hypothetical protein
MFSLKVLDGFFASGFGRFIGRLTVRYRVQMIFGNPVSGFAKIYSEEIISKEAPAFEQRPEFKFEEFSGAGETGKPGTVRLELSPQSNS